MVTETQLAMMGASEETQPEPESAELDAQVEKSNTQEVLSSEQKAARGREAHDAMAQKAVSLFSGFRAMKQAVAGWGSKVWAGTKNFLSNDLASSRTRADVRLGDALYKAEAIGAAATEAGVKVVDQYKAADKRLSEGCTGLKDRAFEAVEKAKLNRDEKVMIAQIISVTRMHPEEQSDSVENIESISKELVSQRVKAEKMLKDFRDERDARKNASSAAGTVRA